MQATGHPARGSRSAPRRSLGLAFPLTSHQGCVRSPIHTSVRCALHARLSTPHSICSPTISSVSARASRPHSSSASSWRTWSSPGGAQLLLAASGSASAVAVVGEPRVRRAADVRATRTDVRGAGADRRHALDRRGRTRHLDDLLDGEGGARPLRRAALPGRPRGGGRPLGARGRRDVGGRTRGSRDCAVPLGGDGGCDRRGCEQHPAPARSDARDHDGCRARLPRLPRSGAARTWPASSPGRVRSSSSSPRAFCRTASTTCRRRSSSRA